MGNDRKKLIKKIIASLIGAITLLASVVSGLHYEGREYLQNNLKSVKADIVTIQKKSEDCEKDRAALRADYVTLSKKVARQEGFIEGQKTLQFKRSESYSQK